MVYSKLYRFEVATSNTERVTWLVWVLQNGEWSALSSVLWVFGWFSLEFIFKVSNLQKKIVIKLHSFETRCLEVTVRCAFILRWNCTLFRDYCDMTPFSSWMPIIEVLQYFLCFFRPAVQVIVNSSTNNHFAFVARSKVLRAHHRAFNK